MNARYGGFDSEHKSLIQSWQTMLGLILGKSPGAKWEVG